MCHTAELNVNSDLEVTTSSCSGLRRIQSLSRINGQEARIYLTSVHHRRPRTHTQTQNHRLIHTLGQDSIGDPPTSRSMCGGRKPGGILHRRREKLQFHINSILSSGSNQGTWSCEVVVILSTNRKDKYDCVKKYLCVDCPTPSQCVVARTLSRPQTLMTIATKISLQMNCRMEGEPWSVETPLKHLMMLVSTATTTVPQERDPSVHWWPASTRACPAVLKAYFKYNECLSSRIVVYRDGVGDGVLLSVVDYEVPQFTQSIKAMGEDSA
ncbi:piwi-like protein 1 [Ictalurus furcatus]|uniref:piwi-like protein 1 n=1 Tax=Ictalurus furcatus TaxID=66913 RepID=UPI002350BD7F|nr:piwi-like protein 1 [Ictalurus furcatus]